MNTHSSKNLEKNQIFTHQKKFLNLLKDQSKSENSLKSYRLDFECFNQFLDIKFKTSFFYINDFSVSEFDHFLENKYSNINSRRRKLQTLRKFFDYLVINHIYPENPIKKIVSAPKSLLPPEPTPFLDIQRVFDSFNLKKLDANASDLEKLVFMRNGILLTLVYEAAITVAPLSKINTNQISILPNEIRVLITSTKRDPYSIGISKKYEEYISEYLTLLKRYQVKENIFFDNLFFYANSYKIIKGGLSPRGMEDILKKISTRFDIVMTPKSLRQSGILKWLLEKQPETSIKEWLGVAPSYSLKLYKKYINEAKEQNTDMLNYMSLGLK